MSDVVIDAEGLGKKYLIGHQTQNGRYTALRDVLAQNARKMWESAIDIARGKPIIHGDAHEEVWALRNVDFEVKRGEVVGVIGRNGAGKSTLLKLLSRITEPSAGRVTIRGRVASLLEVGTGFHPELTGRENIFLNGAILGMRRAEIKAKLDEIVAFAEVEKYLDTPVKRYSSGMYVRLAFAVAAHLEPEILLVDEVLAVGDAAFQKKCLGKMEDVARYDGRTILFVSHNLPSIETLCANTMLIESGSLVSFGNSADIIELYLKGFGSDSQSVQAPTGKNIREVRITNRMGVETNQFFVGDDIVFEIELFHESHLARPRVSIGIHTEHGERLVTIHTDIQQNEPWPFSGTRRIKAVWEDVRMVPYRYRVDVSLWGQSSEIDYLPSCQFLELLPRDIYGTGTLPDPNGQGYFLADAHWDLTPSEVTIQATSE